MDAAFLTQRRDSTLIQINALEAALAALDAGVEEYTLDTGQSRQTVRRPQRGALQATLDAAINRYAILCQRIGGPQGTVGAPDW